MKPNKKIVWDMGNGEVSVTTPNAPMLGRYVVSDGVAEQALFTVERGVPMLTKLVVALDRMVKTGEARFEALETESEYLKRIAEGAKQKIPALAQAAWSATIDAEDHEALDRDFPNAISPSGTIDMGKCREIQKSRLRNVRAPVLAALDVEYQRADESGNAAEKKRIVERKQALRDATADPRIAAAKTPAELLKVALP